MSLTLKALFYVKVKVFTQWRCSSQRKPLFLPYFPTQPSASLSIFLGSCPNCSATCSSYSTRNVVRYIRTGVKPPFAHLNPNTVIVLYYGWRREKAHQCQGSGMEDGFATTWGASHRQGKGHYGGQE